MSRGIKSWKNLEAPEHIRKMDKFRRRGKRKKEVKKRMIERRKMKQNRDR